MVKCVRCVLSHSTRKRRAALNGHRPLHDVVELFKRHSVRKLVAQHVLDELCFHLVLLASGRHLRLRNVAVCLRLDDLRADIAHMHGLRLPLALHDRPHLVRPGIQCLRSSMRLVSPSYAASLVFSLSCQSRSLFLSCFFIASSLLSLRIASVYAASPAPSVMRSHSPPTWMPSIAAPPFPSVRCSSAAA